MADSPTVDNGALADYVVSSDEVTIDGVLAQVQRVKLFRGANGATVPLDVAEDVAHADGDTGIMLLGVREYAGAGTDGDYSALTTDSAGRQVVNPRPDLQEIIVTSAGLTIATTAYTAGDQLGTILTFANAARVSGGGGYITGISVVSAQDAVGAMDLVIFDRSVTLAADNAAFAISDADALFLHKIIPLAGAWDIGNNRTGQLLECRIPFTCNSTSLFAALITRAGHTFFAAVGDLQITLLIERY
jgi:hypothetical protein